jgi:hypothetical protein
MKKWKKGDLVYIPQATTITQRTSTGTVSQFIELKNPATLLVSSGEQDSGRPAYYEVVYRGTKWFVNASDTYPVPNTEIV